MGTGEDSIDTPWQPPSLVLNCSGSADFSPCRLAHRCVPFSPVAGLMSHSTSSGLILDSSLPRFGEFGPSFPACVESDHTPAVGSGSSEFQSAGCVDALVDKLPSSISSNVDQGGRFCTQGTESSAVDGQSLTVVSLQGEVKSLRATGAAGDFAAGMAGESIQASGFVLLGQDLPAVGEGDEDATEYCQGTPLKMVKDLEEGELEEGQLLGHWSSEDVAKSSHSDVLDSTTSSPEPLAETSGQKQREDVLGLMDEPSVSEDFSKVYVRRKSMASGTSGGDTSLSWRSLAQDDTSAAKVKRPRSTRRGGSRMAKLKHKKPSSKETLMNKTKPSSDQPPDTTKVALPETKSAQPLEADLSKPCKFASQKKDEGPEEGEVLPEKGALSALVEDEVGLWTTDVADEEIEQVKEQQDGKGKRGNGPQRKATKKATNRRKRAEKERQLGLRPSKRVKLSEPPPPPPRKLCTFFLKGRCAKGKDCSFSHDCVPLTKSEPCKFLTMGCCLKGPDCPFSHDLALFPCKYFHTRGYCYDAENCRFSHGPITEEERKKLLKRMDQESKDRHQAKERPEGQNEALLTVGHDLPPGYEAIRTQESSPTHENLCLASQTSCLGPVATDGISSFVTQHVQVAAFRGEGSSYPMPSSTSENMPANIGKSMALQERKVEPDVSMPVVDQKEGENFVLLAARKAAADAVAAEQRSISDSRGLTKPILHAPLRRSRGFEGSAMELLTATMSKDGTSTPQIRYSSNEANSAGGSKYRCAMALLEGLLKNDEQ